MWVVKLDLVQNVIARPVVVGRHLAALFTGGVTFFNSTLDYVYYFKRGLMHCGHAKLRDCSFGGSSYPASPTYRHSSVRKNLLLKFQVNNLHF